LTGETDSDKALLILQSVVRDIKDKIKVIAVDVNTAIGRRYSVLMGIQLKEFKP
jgi:hypothetical protein